MAEIRVKNGEAKTITFTVTRSGAVLDLTTAVLAFGVKASYDDTAFLISKTTTDFTLTQASVGIISVNLSSTNLAKSNIPHGTYKAELFIQVTALVDIDICETIDFVVEDSLYG